MADYPIIAQSNDLTKAKYDFDVIEKRIIYFLIQAIREQFVEKQGSRNLFDNMIVQINTDALRKVNDNLNRVYEKAKKLRERSIVINDKDKFLSVGYINYAKHVKNKPYMEFEISREILPYLVELAKNFTTYSLTVAISLRSIYSQRFYELCSQYRAKGYFFISIDELKTMFKIEDKYKDFAQLNQRVIKPAEQELKELYDKGQSELYFTYKIRTKEGKKVTSLEFIIQKKDDFYDESESTTEEYMMFITMYMKQFFARDEKYQNRVFAAIKNDYVKIREVSDKLRQKGRDYGSKPAEMPKIIRHVLKEDFGIE